MLRAERDLYFKPSGVTPCKPAVSFIRRAWRTWRGFL
jgi:hypothetical protein